MLILNRFLQLQTRKLFRNKRPVLSKRLHHVAKSPDAFLNADLLSEFLKSSHNYRPSESQERLQQKHNGPEFPESLCPGTQMPSEILT